MTQDERIFIVARDVRICSSRALPRAPATRAAYSLTMELGAVTHHRARPRGRRPSSTRPVTGVARLRRIALVAALVALIPVVLSYWSSMSQPSNSSLGIRTVEWLRDNGAAGLVARVESIYYTLTAPSKGGPDAACPAQSRLRRGSPGGRRSAPNTGPRACTRWSTRRCPERVSGMPPARAWRRIRRYCSRHCATSPNTRAWSPGSRGSTRRARLDPQPGAPGALGDASARVHGRAAVAASEAARDVQQRVQAQRRPRRIRPERAHLRARCSDGQGTLVGYADGHVDVIDWSYGSTAPAGVVVRPPEPAADRRRRQAQPESRKHLRMGRHGRQRRARMALGRSASTGTAT